MVVELKAPASVLSLDADAEWGVIAVVDQGSALVWQPRRGPATRLPLPRPIGSAVWWEEGKVAVSPQASEARVEIWRIPEPTLLATWGKETPLTPGIGATRLRAVELHVDHGHHRLYSLETFTGEMQAYDSQGLLLWSRTIANPERQSLEKWLAEMDRQAKLTRDIQTPRILTFSFALDVDGTAWVVQALREEPPQGMQLARVAASGEITIRQLDESCYSHSLYVWGEWFVFQRGEMAPGGPCRVVRRLK